MSTQEEFDDFIFKSATSNNTANASNCNSNTSSQSSVNIANLSPTTATNNNSVKTNTRLPALDAFISVKKREMDSELNKLGKERLEEFLNREKQAEQQLYASVNNTIVSEKKQQKKDYEVIGRELDEKEVEMFKALRVRATETWRELEEEYKKTLKDLETEQTARLVQESQLQESLKAGGSVFDRELFEKLVEKCGKGRNTPFGREKMTRFWEVLDRSFPKGTGNGVTKSADDDKLLSTLLGQ